MKKKSMGIKTFLLLLIGCFSAHAGAEKGVTPEYSVMAPLASKSLLLDAVSVRERIVAVGERGHILISEGGDDWRQAEVPTRATLTGVYFHDAKLGWAVGHDSVILRTADGGYTWEKVYSAPEEETPLLDIWFRDEDNGIAMGAYGLYLTSTDGGETWENSEFTVADNLAGNGDSIDTGEPGADDFGDLYELHLNSISHSASGKLYIAAESGRIYRSDDYGNTWLELPSPYIGSLFGVLPLGNESLLVFGLRGHLFRSDDAGMTWMLIDSQTQEMLTNAKRLQDGTVIIVGLGGTVLVSTDNGKSFTPRDTGARYSYSAIVQNTDRDIIVIGDHGVEKLMMLTND